MNAEPRTLRKLVYWKSIPLRPWATYELVQTIEVCEPHTFFEEIVAAVKTAGFDYRIVEITEQLVDTSERK